MAEKKNIIVKSINCSESKNGNHHNAFTSYIFTITNYLKTKYNFLI